MGKSKAPRQEVTGNLRDMPDREERFRFLKEELSRPSKVFPKDAIWIYQIAVKATTSRVPQVVEYSSNLDETLNRYLDLYRGGSSQYYIERRAAVKMGERYFRIDLRPLDPSKLTAI